MIVSRSDSRHSVNTVDTDGSRSLRYRPVTELAGIVVAPGNNGPVLNRHGVSPPRCDRHDRLRGEKRRKRDAYGTVVRDGCRSIRRAAQTAAASGDKENLVAGIGGDAETDDSTCHYHLRV